MDRFTNLIGDYDDLTDSYEEPNQTKYPCVILTGVMTAEELEMLRDKTDVYSYEMFDEEGNNVKISTESCPLYVEFDGVIKEIGTFYFSLDYVLNLKYVGDYKLEICASEDKIRPVNLKDGNDLVSFIRL